MFVIFIFLKVLLTEEKENIRNKVINKCENLGFKSECYVYFKKRKGTFTLFFILIVSSKYISIMHNKARTKNEYATGNLTL